MASKLPVRPAVKEITDLDQSDNQIIIEEKPRKSHRHRSKNELSVKSYSANFPNRSKSVEWRNLVPKDEKSGDVKYLKSMIQTKDAQIEKLVQKITELHNYNNQFAQDNDRLQKEIQIVTDTNTSISKSYTDLQNRICENCSEWSRQYEEMREKCKSRENDVTMMKTLVYRLNVQIERYQDKLRKERIGVDEVEGRHSPDGRGGQTHEWGTVNTHTLGPLLNAYEEMVSEKGDLIEQHEIELNKFTGKLKEVLEENERLQMEMDDLKRGKEGWREERTKLQAQLDVCRSKAEVQTKRADLAKEKLVEVLRSYEQKIQAQSLDLERLQDAYGRTKAELLSVKSTNTQPEAIVDSWRECQKLFEELKAQYEKEKERISAEASDLTKSKSELELKLRILSDENDTLRKEKRHQMELFENLKQKALSLQKISEKLKESRDRLKARLKIALQWGQKLEGSQAKFQNTWDEMKQLEATVKHKEAQIRGLHARHLEEVANLKNRLQQREETIKTILKERTKKGTNASNLN